MRGLKSLVLPLAMSIYLPLFHYSNNADILLLPSLWRVLLAFILIMLVVYTVVLAIVKRDFECASVVTTIIMAFFSFYGLLYTLFIKTDVIQVEHYTLLPVYLLLAVYACWAGAKTARQPIWKAASYILLALNLFNIIKIIPAETEKFQHTRSIQLNSSSISNSSSRANSPDIYYLIFDEAASFNAIRDFWHYQGIDDFVDFLDSKGFFIAENSYASTHDTLTQMSERLNYQRYPSEEVSKPELFMAIADNQVMRFLKSQGYTTVIYSELNYGYPAMPPIISDVLYEYGKRPSMDKMIPGGSFIDDFSNMVANSTLLRVFIDDYSSSFEPRFVNHYSFIYYTEEDITRLDDIPSPKFIYAHLLLPHDPFMFSENGSINDIEQFYNWNYYLGNYQFTIQYIEKIITGILDNADPFNPPIIIIQSDHGPRNKLVEDRHGVVLEGYPEIYKTSIINAMYLPGYDLSLLPDDIDPINTFPLIFNHYFDMDIPLLK